MTAFTAHDSRPLTLERRGRFATMYVLSPFVWRADGRWHLLVRAVPRRDDEPRLKMAEAYYGVGDDGVHFVMDEAPALWPGPEEADLDGCEDPTVVLHEGRTHVWYTGWNQAQETGRLLYANGPNARDLTTRGVALDSTAEFANPKEATVAPSADGGWALFFEFARDEASVIGVARGEGLGGPWTGSSPLMEARGDHFDSWHLSTGPIVGAGGDRPVMFYNGASREAKWRIGWVAFDPDLTRVVDRCKQPLVTPPDDCPDGWTDIAFAASAVEDGDDVWLYHSIADRVLRRVRVRRGE